MREFVWRDAGRNVVFGPGGIERAGEILAEQGIEEFQLFSTERALRDPAARGGAGGVPGAAALAAAASAVHRIPSGQVPDLAAALLAGAGEILGAMRPKGLPPALVALGGGRVVDVAKAVASVVGAEVVALPTTMSGAEMTAIHRLPAGAESEAQGQVRPRLVIADPEAMTSQPEAALRASSMNALAHGADSLYTPFANPVAAQAAIRGAGLIAAALDEPRERRERGGLAFGSVLCGYAIDSAGLGLHHVACQTLVRVCGTPHAETNAAVLPHALAFLAGRAPAAFAPLAAALGTDLDGLASRTAALGRPPAPETASTQPGGPDRGLETLADAPERLEQALDAMLKRPELAHVPGPAVSRAELAGIVSRAWA